MVHMPSHIYLRTGNYSKGGSVNEEAVKSYKKVVQLFAPAAGADFLYVIHNLHMQTNHAIMSGDMNYASESAKQTAASIPADYLLMEGAMGNYLQYIYHTPVLVDVRYARWDALLAMTQPPAKQVYSNVLYHFGKGMAYAHQQKLPEAKREYDYLSMLLKDTTLSLPFAPFSPAIDGATVAANLLAGSMALAQNNNKAAIEHFSKAVTTEEQMVYNEPRDWLLNPKHYLGNAYLQQKDWKNAEKTLLNDLKNNNNNIWALSGLYTAYMQQSKTKEAAAVQQEIKKAGKNAVAKITAPVL
jgi:tetratricopeptide (TPR) repeat protein